MEPDEVERLTTVGAMADVRAIVSARARRLAGQSFIASLESASTLEEVRAFVPQLYFFVFAFQDMLRLAHERIVDPKLREIAARQRREDAGHETWFMSDVSELGCSRDVSWVFGDAHQPSRDFCYELVAELLRATDDRIRLLFPLMLEASGAIFFFRVIDLLDRVGFRGQLRYFARSHQEVEAAHDMFSAAGEAEIDAIEFDRATYVEAIAVVHRCFDHFERWGIHLDENRASALARR